MSDVRREGERPSLMSTAAKLGMAPLSVLLIGEQEQDFFLIREILERNKSALPADLHHASSLEEARKMLPHGDYGLLLFGHAILDSLATKLLAELLEAGNTIPFIVLTEHADEKAIASIIQAGASDCVDKSQLDGANLLRTIRFAVSLHSSQLHRRNAEDSLRKLSCAVEQSADTIMITNSAGMIEYVNPAFELLTGYSREDAVGQSPGILTSGQQAPALYRELWENISVGNVYNTITVNRKKNGELYYVDESISPIRDAVGNITHFVSNGRDLTKRLHLEEQLLQAQKMDAVGRLAGGVAHDFNNLLTIITSYSELALDTAIAGSLTRDHLQEILTAARRAAELTRQLLAFSRNQPQALRVEELNPVVRGVVKTLQRLIGEDIELTFIPGEGLGRIRLDPMQIEQILMNLAANARDAMPEGGKCTIETAAIYLDEDYVAHKKSVIPTGQYAALIMTDSGSGISPDHLPHIFDPFYTTKPSGRGTGLGLATVYGIVKQNHGFVWAYSEVGMGTVFKIYLPCVRDGSAKTDIVPKTAEPLANGTETVLLVEDEPALRRASAEFLRLHGYTVLEAKDGEEALAVAKSFDSAIHLAVTDVVMPRMSGGQMAKEFAASRPEIKMLFVSGYAGQTILDHQVVNVENNFLQKPFTLRQLASKMRQVLDGDRNQIDSCGSTSSPDQGEDRQAAQPPIRLSAGLQPVSNKPWPAKF
jgi:two-component system, cell cycle sensor histidine kinase and response regulator CckA